MSISDIVPWNWGKKKGIARKSDDPFSALRRQMDDVFENFLSGDLWNTPASVFGERGFSPKINVRETDKEIVVTAELPGMSEDNVQLDLTDDALNIRGEKRESREEKGEDGVREYYESSYGSFQRTIPLHTEIESDKVDATFKNGVLTVKLPKSARAKSNVRKVSIRSEH